MRKKTLQKRRNTSTQSDNKTHLKKQDVLDQSCYIFETKTTENASTKLYDILFLPHLLFLSR